MCIVGAKRKSIIVATPFLISHSLFSYEQGVCVELEDILLTFLCPSINRIKIQSTSFYLRLD
jgi:hypothetical protein